MGRRGDFWATLAAELEDIPGRAEDRLLEASWSSECGVIVPVRGRELTFSINASMFWNSDLARLKTLEKIAVNFAILATLRTAGLAPGDPTTFHSLHESPRESNIALSSDEIESIRDAMMPLAHEASRRASERRESLDAAIAAAAASLNSLARGDIEKALEYARAAERIERDLDGALDDHCIAVGGGATGTDETETTFLALRSRIQGALELVERPDVLLSLTRLQDRPSLFERKELLGKLGGVETRGVLLRIAMRRALPTWLRRLAVWALAQQEKLTTDEIGRLIDCLRYSGEMIDKDLALELVGSLTRHSKDARLHPRCARILEALLALPLDEDTRVVVLGALSRFAEIDVVERVVMLPHPTESERKAVADLVKAVLTRPRRVSRLRPKSFEHLVFWLLQREHPHVRYEVVGRPYDGGVDIQGNRPPTSGVDDPGIPSDFVQCKNRRRIAVRDIEDFAAQVSCRTGWSDFVTTARCDSAVHRRAEELRVRLIDGARLQELLDEHASGQYIV
jgi:hypothetical protein